MPVVLHVGIRPKIDPYLDEQGGRIRNFKLKIRTNRRDWTEHRLIRDREAPGSNPGPPTKVPLFEPANKT